MLSNMTGNLVKLLNDVSGTATVLSILAATGILGAKFVFNVSPKALANDAGDLLIEEFRNQYRDAVQRRVATRGIGSEVADERATSVVGGLQNLVEAALAPIFAITGGIDMPEIRRPGQ